MTADPIGAQLVALQQLIDGVLVSINDSDVPVAAHTVLPEKISPPFLYIFNDVPYLTPAEAEFGTVRVNYVVGFAAMSGDNASEVSQANQAIYAVYQRLTFSGDGSLVAGDANVGRISLNSNDFFGATVTVAGSIPLEEA